MNPAPTRTAPGSQQRIPRLEFFTPLGCPDLRGGPRSGTTHCGLSNFGAHTHSRLISQSTISPVGGGRERRDGKKTSPSARVTTEPCASVRWWIGIKWAILTLFARGDHSQL